MKLDELVTVPDMQAAIDNGLVRKQTHPTLSYDIYNYTHLAQNTWQWPHAARVSRGLIVNRDTNEIIARPFEKFFNHDEQPQADRLWNADEPVHVYDKLDGSLGVLYPTDTGHAVATRGSFTSEQAIMATRIWQQKYAATTHVPPGATLLFEIVYPDNRIVVDYGDTADLYLLGMVDIDDGGSYSVHQAARWSAWQGPRADLYDFTSFADALAAAPRPNAEGYVVHLLHSDQRVKIKQDDYKALHRIVSGMSVKTVVDHLAENGDVTALRQALFGTWLDWLDRTEQQLLWKFSALHISAELAYAAAPQTSRKDFALAVKQYEPVVKAICFAMLDNKKYAHILWRYIRDNLDSD